MKRDFEKVSFEQFKKDCIKYDFDPHDENVMQGWYDDLQLPRRATRRSSGYDFCSPFTFNLAPNHTIKFPTGIKAFMLDDEELKLYPRSSVGIDYRIEFDNTVPKIDADYFGNIKNEGDIICSLTNMGHKWWNVSRGDKIVQGSFYKYLITDSDFPVKDDRIGGLGSSGK